MNNNLKSRLLSTAAVIAALAIASPAVHGSTEKPEEIRIGATEKPEAGDTDEDVGAQDDGAIEESEDEARDEPAGDGDDTAAGEDDPDAAGDDTAASEDDATSSEDDTAAGEGQSFDGQIVLQEANTTLASGLIGTTVYTPDDESLGDINDVILSESGEIVGVVIGVGGFLGMGEKEVAVEYDRIQQSPYEDGTRLFLDVSLDELEAAPDFQTLEAQRQEEEMRQLQQQQEQEQPDTLAPETEGEY